MKTTYIGDVPFNLGAIVTVDEDGSLGRISRYRNCPVGIEYMITSSAYSSALTLTHKALMKFNKQPAQRNEEIVNNQKAIFGCTTEGVSQRF